MQEAIRPKRRNKAYTTLVEVELLHDGQALQHKLQAALPQQQAKFAAQAAAEQAPKTPPIVMKCQDKFIQSGVTKCTTSAHGRHFKWSAVNAI